VINTTTQNPSDNRGKHKNHKKGSQHPKWNHNCLISSTGYKLIRVGKEHPLGDPNGYCKEHNLIICSAIGKILKKNEIVHHINGDKLDNRLKNLKIMTISEHNKIHNKQNFRNAKGQFIGKNRAGRLLDGREWNELP
jgi:hypothetical protein